MSHAPNRENGTIKRGRVPSPPRDNHTWNGNVKEEGDLDFGLREGVSMTGPGLGVGAGAGQGSRRCDICHDLATGNHYGSWSCEGCKAFFKRSVQGNAQYVCVRANACELDGSGRKHCPACRLRRCFESGMTDESIKKDRKGNSSSMSQSIEMYRSENRAAGQLLHKLMALEMKSVAGDFALPEAGDQALSANSYLIKVFARLADRMLSFYVEWAKSIPGYSLLSVPTQRGLLSRCFFVQVLVDIAYHSSFLGPEQIRFSADIIMTYDALIELCDKEYLLIHEDLFQACADFKQLQLSFEEFVSLKCLIIFTSEELQDPVTDQNNLHNLQDQIFNCLSYAVHETRFKLEKNLDEGKTARRISKILLLLSRLRRISHQLTVHLSQLSHTLPIFELVGSLIR